MSEMKSYSRVNGWMLLSVFSVCSLVTFAPDLYHRRSKVQPEQTGFARLIRAEDKSYFGYHRYYFTLLYRSGDEDVRFVTAVDSDLFHLRKVGDNVEVLIRSAHDLRLARNESEKPDYATLMLSLFFAAVGFVLLLNGIRYRKDT
ncbi:MAG: hypothetical protein CVV45_02505 [Spirochaetae bacterium HGW-Spirochaetae-10]|nr:MAG: hypothetical protein CVV45_02505 [Spirochaetae bacterium HGW-Spirochaetae-10]